MTRRYQGLECLSVAYSRNFSGLVWLVKVGFGQVSLQKLPKSEV